MHLTVEAGRKPLAPVLTAGQAADSPRFNRHEQDRAFATRSDELAVRYDATVEITDITIYLRDSSNRR